MKSMISECASNTYGKTRSIYRSTWVISLTLVFSGCREDIGISEIKRYTIRICKKEKSHYFKIICVPFITQWIGNICFKEVTKPELFKKTRLYL